jgi:hypothetical protein
MNRLSPTHLPNLLAGTGRLRLVVRHMQVVVGLLLLTASLAQAQAPPPPAAPVVTISRSWYLEAVIVAAMFGLALFVVCRSSRRN